MTALSDAASCVSALLDCVARCGSVVLRSLSILSAGRANADGRLAALEALRGLSECRQISAEIGILINHHLRNQRSRSHTTVKAGCTLYSRTWGV